MADNVEQLDANDVSYLTATKDKGANGHVQYVTQDIGTGTDRVPFVDPATGAKQDTANAALATLVSQTDAVEGSLSSILAKLPTGGATDATLAQVRDAIKAQIDVASTIWTDNSGAYYVRRDLVNEGTGAITVAFTAPDGTTATPGAGLRPLATVDRDVTQALFDVITTGTGYTAGDLLARVAIIDANAATPTVTAIWVNLTTAAVISAPTSGHIERADETIGARQVGTWNVGVSTLPATAATTANQLTTHSKLDAIDAEFGSDGTTPPTLPGSSSGVRGWLRGLYETAVSLLARIPALLTSEPSTSGSAVPVRQVASTMWAPSFARAASALDTPDLTGVVAPGMSLTQANNTLAITTGTTANRSTLLRSTRSFLGPYVFRYIPSWSARPSGVTTAVVIGDLIGEGCAYTINSTTSVSVTLPAGHGFTAANVGQSMWLGGFSAAGIGGRYPIASVSGNVLTFTVAGFPASGSGTVTVYGWNAHWLQYTSASSTTAIYGASRDGYADAPQSSGADLNAVQTLMHSGWTAQFMHWAQQQLRAVGTSVPRAVQSANLPSDTVPVYVFLAADTSTTTSSVFSVRHLSMEEIGRQRVSFANNEHLSANSGLPVYLSGAAGDALLLATSNNRIGAVGASVATYTESSTPLAANATFTGTARDMYSGIAQNGYATHQNVHAAECRVAYCGDTVADLIAEVSQDGTVWYAQQPPKTAVLTRGGNYAASIEWKPTTKWYRVVVVNGATAQSRCIISSAMLAA